MYKNISKTMLALAVVAGLPSSASADDRLTIRGGYGGALTDYTYALNLSKSNTEESSYGAGVYGHAALASDDMFGSVGGEISMSYNRLSNDSSYHDPSACDIIDVLSLSIDSCRRGAETSNVTKFGQFRVMTARDHDGTGAQLLGGLGVLGLSSYSNGGTVYGGQVSDINRSNYYAGMGLVFGARKAFQISNNAMLKVDGFAGAYAGNREVKINDQHLGSTGSLSRQDQQTVFSLDLSASVAVPAESIATGGLLEVGVAYTRLFNVIDAANYNDYSASVHGYRGSDSEDVDALSLFVGLQIPL